MYDLQMQVDALITSLILYDMRGFFQVLQASTVEQLEIFTEESILCTDMLANVDEDNDSEVMRAATDVVNSEDNLAGIIVTPKNLLKDFKE